MGDSNTLLLDDDYIIVDDSDTEEVEEVQTKMDTDEVQFIPKDNATIAEECKNLGNDNYKAQNYQSALKLYSDAISLCPDNPSYYGNRAACSMMLGNYIEALQDAQTSVRIDDTFEKGYVRIIKCCVLLGDIIGAEQAIMKLSKCDPLNSIIKTEQQNCQFLRQFETKVQTNYENKVFRTCVYLLDSALKIATACLKYKLIKAECLAFLGRIEEAGDIAVSALKIDSTSADAFYVRGLCLYYNDNLEKGVLHFERALKLDPDHVKAKDMRIKSKLLKEKKEKGNLLYKSGKYREALQLYTEALEIDPYNTDMKSKLLYNRALVNSKLRLTNDAVADCSNVLNINSAYLKALLLRARCYSELEKFDECVRDYESALNIQRTSEIKNLLREAKFALKKSKRKDYYKILGISKNASLDEIKKAYRKKALAHHPDRHASSSEADKKDQELKFKEIGEAYEILADPVKKQRFDSGQDFEDGNQHEMDPNAMFKQFFQFSSGGGGPNVYNFQF